MKGGKGMEKIKEIQNKIAELTEEEAKEKQRQEEEKADRERRLEWANLKGKFYKNLCNYGIGICEKEQSQITPEELKMLPEIARIILNVNDMTLAF